MYQQNDVLEVDIYYSKKKKSDQNTEFGLLFFFYVFYLHFQNNVIE
jgi:hypothetical protein